MENIIEILGRLLAAIVMCLIAYLAPKVKEWLTANAGESTTKQIEILARAFARAAEQLLKNQDPTGEKRNKYVVDQLEALGIEVTQAVMAIIEGAVWEINIEQKARTLPETKK